MLRQRKKKFTEKSRSHKPSSLSRKRKNSISLENTIASALDFIGIRKLRPNPPLSEEDQKSVKIDAIVTFILFVITLASRLYRIAEPAKIVFDEFHFAAFVDNYISGKYLFDIHPPLGKLTLTAVAKLGGYKHINYTFDALGKPFGDLVFVPQRVFSALTGSFIPPVMYLTCRALSLTPLVSITTAAMPLFDFLLCIESRLILTDSQLILFIQTSMLFAFKLWQTPKSTPKRYLWLVLTAFFGACALSTKWTAIVAPGLIAIVSITGFLFDPATSILDPLEMIIAAAIAASIYITTFFMHFKLLPNSGPGDAFMQQDFQQTLIGNTHYTKYASSELPAPSFLDAFWYLNWEMLRANSAIEERHHWESNWYEWLYNARGVLYIDEHLAGGLRQQIYLISNPVLTVLSGLGVIACFLILLYTPFSLRRIRGKTNGLEQAGVIAGVKQRAGMIVFYVCGWVLNLVPYVGVKRCTFLYHVLPSLQMASVMSGIALQQMPRGLRGVVCVGAVMGMAGAYWWWRAWIYAIPQTIEQHDKLRLLPRWN